MHRTYHVSRVPTFNRKVRVIADWTLALFFRREIVSLGALQNPREEFEFASRPPIAQAARPAARKTTTGAAPRTTTRKSTGGAAARKTSSATPARRRPAPTHKDDAAE